MDLEKIVVYEKKYKEKTEFLKVFSCDSFLSRKLFIQEIIYQGLQILLMTTTIH